MQAAARSMRDPGFDAATTPGDAMPYPAQRQPAWDREGAGACPVQRPVRRLRQRQALARTGSRRIVPPGSVPVRWRGMRQAAASEARQDGRRHVPAFAPFGDGTEDGRMPTQPSPCRR